MNLPTISMERTEARKLFLEYRTAVRDSLDREAATYDERKAAVLATRRETDEAIMAGYRLLSLGRTVIDLERAVHEGGADDLGRPRLAVARADVARVETTVWRDGSVSFEDAVLWHRGRRPQPGSRHQHTFRFPAGTLPTSETTVRGFSAIVPTVPPHLRPDMLDRYHILWEAEWSAQAPRDPALLRALGGGLYAVLAVWDLTEVERAVLGVTRR